MTKGFAVFVIVSYGPGLGNAFWPRLTNKTA